MEANLTINVTKELDKAAKLLCGIRDLSDFTLKETDAIKIQKHCQSALHELQIITSIIRNQK